MKELLHTSAEQNRALLVSIVGVAGIGKSRLAWEFFKYIDGLADAYFWHLGRCLAYGDGVTYWALAEMVRSRAGIVEAEDPASASAKLHTTVETYVADADERRWVEARLAQLLGLEPRTSNDREDLFAGWRLFFERMAEINPVVLSFEDMQWADSALLDFVEYLLDWSRNHPIFVITLTRPELLERQPNWGAAHRNFTSISLEPLAPEAMRALISGLVPGLPEDARERILDRAEGIPLYAVETIRMLIDRGVLVGEDGAYRPAGPIDSLDIPETLQALIAARLDDLNALERHVIEDASVLGKTFTRKGLSQLSGIATDELSEPLEALIRKELVSLQADPRSPERGHYIFLQDMVRKVAYESLPKRDRKEKHLASAAYLEGAFQSEEDEVVEIIASHYRSAFELAPGAEDAESVKTRARDMTMRAGERAAALADGVGAQRYFELAIVLTDEELELARTEERAGQMALHAGRPEAARAHFDRAISLYDALGETHPSARVSAQLGEIDFGELHIHQGIERMEKAFALLSKDEPDADLVTLAAQLGRFHLFAGASDVGLQRVEFALEHAETLKLREQFVQALNTKAVIMEFQGRKEEALLLLRHTLAVALGEDLSVAALRAYNNLLAFLYGRDSLEEMLDVGTQGIELARRIGDRTWEGNILCFEMDVYVDLGEWDRALDLAPQIREKPGLGSFILARQLDVIPIHINRGDLAAARELIDEFRDLEGAEEIQTRAFYLLWKSQVLSAEGNLDEAITAADAAASAYRTVGSGERKNLIINWLNVAFNADRARAAEVLREIEMLKPGEILPSVSAEISRIHAKLSPTPNLADFEYAIGVFRELSMSFSLAVVLFEYAQSLADLGRYDESRAPLDEAQTLFEKLRATPWIDRVASLAAQRSTR